MALYQFHTPPSWDNFRDIDEKVDEMELRDQIAETIKARKTAAEAAAAIKAAAEENALRR